MALHVRRRYRGFALAGKMGTGAATAASAACPVGRGKEARSTPAYVSAYQVNQSD